MRPVVLVALIGCPRPAPPTQIPPEPPPVPPLTFAWPSPSQVQVTEEGVKDGTSFASTYRLEIEPHEQGLRVGFEDFRFLSLDGVPAEELPPEVLAQTTAAGSMIPDLLVARDGSFAGVQGMEEMLGQLLPMLTEGDAAEEARLQAMFAQPEFQATVEKEAGKIWDGWVGTWLAQAPHQAQVRLGAAPEQQGAVRLELAVEDAELPEGAMQQLASVLGPVPEGLELEASMGYEAVLLPDTMQPLSASRTQRLRATYQGQEQELLETHHYRFDWR